MQGREGRSVSLQTSRKVNSSYLIVGKEDSRGNTLRFFWLVRPDIDLLGGRAVKQNHGGPRGKQNAQRNVI